MEKTAEKQVKFDRKLKVIAIVVGLYALVVLIGQLSKQPTIPGTQIPTPTPFPTKETVIPTPVPTKALPIKVSFTGKIEPSVLHSGEKTIITFEVVNEDAQRPVEGARILFADENFVSKGLTVVNVMSGGVHDGRAFEWENELMKIPPGGKREFVIVARANETGSYQSVVTFTNPTGVAPFDNQGQELNAKLLVY